MYSSGVIFDFNGTLFFDSDKHEAAWQKFAVEVFGKTITENEFKNYVHGKTNTDIISYFTGSIPDSDTLREYTNVKENYYRELCLEDINNLKLVLGAVELFEYLGRLNIPFTIATASEVTNLKFFIKEFKLERWFDISKIVYDDGSFRGKPFPDIFIKAAGLIGVPISKCIVFEDAISGIKAALAAKANRIICVSPNRESFSANDVDGIDEFIKDFYQFDKEWFVDKPLSARVLQVSDAFDVGE